MKNGLIFVLLVLLALAWAGGDRQPRAEIEDTTRSQITNAAVAEPKPKPPFAWRLNSLCLIDEHKSQEHVA